ncbi:hypothetical protein BDZ45DRAFT_736377 [Acephala macrosclerotiorum]|nr:hypothetical protein BDZ45DRAFT_736377 [Acephala macrosclerotiorum]
MSLMGNAAVAPSISLWLGLEHDPANLARPDQERTPNWPWRTGDQGRRIGRANKRVEGVIALEPEPPAVLGGASGASGASGARGASGRGPRRLKDYQNGFVGEGVEDGGAITIDLSGHGQGQGRLRYLQSF